MSTLRQYRLLSEQRDVPKDRGGLYLFRLRFPSDYELGISLGVTPEISKIVAITAHYLQKVEKALASIQLAGTLSEANKAYHLKTSYNLTAAVSSFGITNEVEPALFRAAELGALAELLNTLRIFFEFLPPLYIGMTARQSLYERLEQHVNETTSLHDRFLACDINWTELSFGDLTDFLYQRDGETIAFARPDLAVSGMGSLSVAPR